MLIFKNIIIMMIIGLMITGIFSGYSLSQPPPGSEEAKEKILQFKKIKILEILDLNEETSNKFLAKYTAYEKKIMEKKEAMDKSIDDLQSTIKSGSDKDLKEKIKSVEQNQKEFSDLIFESLQSMKTILNDTQFAKYLVFESRFKEEIQKFMMKRMGKERRKKRFNDD